MQSAQPPRPRAVLLGASNLTASLPVVVDLAREALGAPLDVYAALGRGRSYGVRSSFLVRSMPGIAGCGLWQALEREPPGPMAALVSDIGNDLAFCLRPEAVAGWVETALDRLQPLGARTVLSTLPLANLHRLPPWKFELFRRLLFPRHPIDRLGLISAAERLDELLREIARARGVHLVEIDIGWYGLDPIHFSRSQRGRAWRSLLAPWFGHAGAPEGAATRGRTASGGLDWRSELLAPAERSFLGVPFHRDQPCKRLPDGTRVHLF